MDVEISVQTIVFMAMTTAHIFAIDAPRMVILRVQAAIAG
jgi:hypothetical protein